MEILISLFWPFVGAVITGFIANYWYKKQQKIILENQTELVALRYQYKKENELSDIKKNILFAWQDIYSGNVLADVESVIGSPNYASKAYVGDVAFFHLGNFARVIRTEDVNYSNGRLENIDFIAGYANGYAELIAFTLMYSSDVKIHQLVHLLNSFTNVESYDEENGNKKVAYDFTKHIETVAIHNLIYYYLKIEWLGSSMDNLSKTSLYELSRQLKIDYIEKDVIDEIERISKLI